MLLDILRLITRRENSLKEKSLSVILNFLFIKGKKMNLLIVVLHFLKEKKRAHKKV